MRPLGLQAGLKALRAFEPAQADFADCLLARSAAFAGCEKTMTFDRGAAKSAGMILIA
jgi:predicted nucleic-acid-binding protein